jgi:hypothetical protein
MTRASGEKRSSVITVRKKSTLPLILNGGQSQQQNMGLPGIMGILAVYNRVLTDDEQTGVRDAMKSVMAMRGVIVS